MKKIIISAAIILAASVSQAAAIGWTSAGATGYSTYDVFVIGLKGVTGADQIKTIVQAGGLAAASDYAFASGTLNNGAAVQMANTSPYSITYGGEGTETYTAFVFVQDAAGENASYSASVSITMDNDATSKTFAFANQAGNFSANTFTVNTPEPTSGVLFLLGMAGLALKRKRA